MTLSGQNSEKEVKVDLIHLSFMTFETSKLSLFFTSDNGAYSRNAKLTESLHERPVKLQFLHLLLHG